MADDDFARLRAEIRACRTCLDAPKPLPHLPNPVFRASKAAKILIAGQAPGARVHASGMPFTDPSGDRLRNWLGVSPEQFYDEARFAIIPMGFCFPGNDSKGGDLPPRAECRATWHDALFASLPAPQLILCIGQYAMDYHFSRLGITHLREPSLTETTANWREILVSSPIPLFPLPHPSWRNSGWLKKNPWFEAELLPVLRQKITQALGADTPP